MKKIPLALALLTIIHMLPATCGMAGDNPPSAVQADARIGDFEARRELARSLANSPATLPESLEQYRILLKDRPDDQALVSEAARVLMRHGDMAEARKLLEKLGDLKGRDAELLFDLADAEGYAGHAARCRDIYLQAAGEKGLSGAAAIRQADASLLWGDFLSAEKAYRTALLDNPGSFDLGMKLANLLASMQRYEEAEGIYLELAKGAEAAPLALSAFANARFLQKDFEGACEAAFKAVAAGEKTGDALAVKAKSLEAMRRYPEALQCCEELAQNKQCRLEALLCQGRIYAARKETEQARQALTAAQKLSPENAEAAYLLSAVDSGGLANPALPEAGKATAGKLSAWAETYAAHGKPREALAYYEQALKLDSEYYPAVLGKAACLAQIKDFSNCLQAYAELAAKFPGAWRIQLEQARVLAWAKHYEEALAQYDRLLAASPGNPVLLREKARTALWAKRHQLAMEAYKSALIPPVDELLLAEMGKLPMDEDDMALSRAVEAASNERKQGSIYQGYERFLKVFAESTEGEAKGKTSPALVVAAKLRPLYLIQKSIELERRMKLLSWNGRNAKSAEVARELLCLCPGNEEALFDLAQAECAIGLQGEALEAYRQLVDIDPQHNLANEALGKLEKRQRPSAQGAYSFWEEKGHGELSAIRRHRIDSGCDLPVVGDQLFQLREVHWLEKSSLSGRSYDADGFALDWNRKFSPWVAGNAGWTHKDYHEDVVDNIDTGHAGMEVNLNDAATLGFGYKRQEEIANEYALLDGTTSDAGYLSLKSQVTRKLEMGCESQWLAYSDHNQGDRQYVYSSYAITDHPRMLKATVFGERRDVREANLYEYQGAVLTDIGHPYWTPEEYTSGGGTLSWRQDLSRFQYRGADLCHYDLSVTAATDSDNNTSLEYKAVLHWELCDRWTFEASGLIHNSRDWDASVAFVSLGMRF